MKVQVFNNKRGGTTLVVEGQDRYIPFGYSPDTILAVQAMVKERLALFETSDSDDYAPVGEPVGTIEV